MPLELFCAPRKFRANSVCTPRVLLRARPASNGSIPRPLFARRFDPGIYSECIRMCLLRVYPHLRSIYLDLDPCDRRDTHPTSCSRLRLFFKELGPSRRHAPILICFGFIIRSQSMWASFDRLASQSIVLIEKQTDAVGCDERNPPCNPTTLEKTIKHIPNSAPVCFQSLGL